jgi:membrane-associated phospholipid phosphatase
MTARARVLAIALACGCGLVTFSGSAEACEPETAALPHYGTTPTPFDRLGCNLLEAGGGNNLLFYGAAILSTMQLSGGGADHHARVAFETHLQSRPFADAMVVFGFVGPPAIGVLLYSAGLVRGDREMSGAGAAAIQAMSITFAATVVLKGTTGRPFPNHGGDPRSADRLEHPEWSREWNGPLLENSAWPSGHTSVAVSLAASLTAYQTDARWVPWVTYPTAGAVAFGMLSGAHHWLSDVVAGALLGQAVGWSVGHNFRRMQDARSGKSSDEGLDVSLVPLPGTNGAALVGTF